MTTTSTTAATPEPNLDVKSSPPSRLCFQKRIKHPRVNTQIPSKLPMILMQVTLRWIKLLLSKVDAKGSRNCPWSANYMTLRECLWMRQDRYPLLPGTRNTKSAATCSYPTFNSAQSAWKLCKKRPSPALALTSSAWSASQAGLSTQWYVLCVKSRLQP